MNARKTKTLVEEKLAVSLFLESLLREPEEVTELAEPVTETVTRVESAPAISEPVVSKVLPEVKTSPEPLTTSKIAPETTTEVEIQEKSETVVETDSQVPGWATGAFQVLLFEVAGLKLAVPLVELSGVIEWNESVTEMPGHADFYMGILQHLGNKVAVIDTARMVLPAEKLSALSSENPRDRVNHIVLIDDYRWGLACDTIGEVITLDSDDVKWRTSKTSRSWLAGTVIEHMCALLNSEGFSQMLVKGKTISD